ncbi:MAG TPA: DUF433 domain-containing protein [Pyrinomonadaceae bacterium]
MSGGFFSDHFLPASMRLKLCYERFSPSSEIFFDAPSANTLIKRCLKSVRLERGGCGRYTFYMKEEKVIQLDPDILGGTPVFSGTRVPIKSLFDHIEGGDSIDDFLEGFPSVRRDQVIALLEISQERVLQPA